MAAGIAQPNEWSERSPKPKLLQKKAEMLRTSGDLDPLSNTCAARALKALDLSDNVDFDEGIRIIKGGLRDATVGDSVLNALQDEIISKHKTDNRDADGRCNGLPKDIADVLGTIFHLLPHEFCGNLRHLRGSFPQAVKAAGTLMSANQKKKVPMHLGQKLFEFREQIHEPAYHESSRKVKPAESAQNTLECNVAGFCVHGHDGVLVRAMHASLMQAVCLKRFPQQHPGRKLLCTSGVVVCTLAGKTTAAPEAAVGVHDPPPAPIVTAIAKWAHLGDVSLKPMGVSIAVFCPVRCAQTFLWRWSCGGDLSSAMGISTRVGVCTISR